MQNLTESISYHYGEADITFADRNGIMVNATEMARAFGKRPVDWRHITYSLLSITASRKTKSGL